MNLPVLIIFIGEITFWFFLLISVILRYQLGFKKISISMLIMTVIINILQMIVIFVHLFYGAKPTFFHGLTAVFIGFSLIYGRRTIQWADKWAAYKWSAGSKPIKVDKSANISYQWNEFYRVCLCVGLITTLILISFFFVPFEDAFWLIYWLVVNVSIIIFWLFFGPLKAIKKAQTKR
ncbi:MULTISPECIES: hypothetical protein [Staphylococcus]|uniref:hypothetical protein n=1 Tax=Staphylococcus TaxID=1279 RepID=UPI001431959F|nr:MULTISPECIES: hypothetical protein [Staphylococcus]MBF0770523.1 hypothetical protein [Staphylococcus warneri]MCG3402918.1 hypothetical protein [Staphylococcus massiliensis]